MSIKDRNDLKSKAMRELTHRGLHAGNDGDKRTHKIKALRKLNARINTFNKQDQNAN